MDYKSFDDWITVFSDCMLSFETQTIAPEIATDYPKWKTSLLIYEKL